MGRYQQDDEGAKKRQLEDKMMKWISWHRCYECPKPDDWDDFWESQDGREENREAPQ